MPESGPPAMSAFPGERNPGLFLIAYRGNLGEDAGIPNSVYTINEAQIEKGKLKQVGEVKMLRPGESWTLDDGGVVTFVAPGSTPRSPSGTTPASCWSWSAARSA